MNLLLQSRSTGEKLYPYIAALKAGYLKTKEEPFKFIDLNFHNKDLCFNNVKNIYIFISWIAIENHEENIKVLEGLVLQCGSNNIFITSDDITTLENLKGNKNLSPYIKNISQIISQDRLSNVTSDFSITSPQKYSHSLFFKTTNIPLICSFSFPVSYQKTYRNIENLQEEISYIRKKWNINNFIFEDQFDENDSSFVNVLVESLSTLPTSIRWCSLSGIPPLLLKGIDLIKLKRSGCIAIALNLNPLTEQSIKGIKKLHIHEINSVGYFKLHYNTENMYQNLSLILRSVFLKTVINHYFYQGKRNRSLNMLTLTGYTLSLLNPSRVIRLFSIIALSKNTYNKILDKYGRINS